MSRSVYSEHVAVRVRPDVLARVDALIPRFTSPLGLAVHRSDVLRFLVETGLREIDEGRVKVDEVQPNAAKGRGRKALHG